MSSDWQVIEGDCIERMREMPEASVDAIVCDPPYGLEFMGKGWDTFRAKNRNTQTAADMRVFQEWTCEWAVEALRILKPGGHLLAFGGTRTYHRLACAIEDAGFEVRDCLVWLYSNGFPKSRNLDGDWQGWGTTLKPAYEPIVVARKPLIGTVAANVQQHGTGALNIDGCRIGDGGRWPANAVFEHSENCDLRGEREVASTGHWTSSKITGYGDGIGNGKAEYHGPGKRPGTEIVEDWDCAPECPVRQLDEQKEGGASRFYYCAKASKREREAGLEAFSAVERVNGNKWTDEDYRVKSGERPPSAESRPRRNIHPTVKPIELMRWLVRLVTPPGGTVLDPFAGSGTTGCAVARENNDPERAPGWSFIGIEREAEYAQIARARIAYWDRPPEDIEAEEKAKRGAQRKAKQAAKAPASKTAA